MIEQLLPGWFSLAEVRKEGRRIQPSREIVARRDAYIAGYEDGQRAGKKELLKIAEGKMGALIK